MRVTWLGMAYSPKLACSGVTAAACATHSPSPPAATSTTLVSVEKLRTDIVRRSTRETVRSSLLSAHTAPSPTVTLVGLSPMVARWASLFVLGSIATSRSPVTTAAPAGLGVRPSPTASAPAIAAAASSVPATVRRQG